MRQGELWCAFLALSLGLSLASYLVPTGTNASPLTSFTDRAINPAVIEGVDVTSVGRSYGQFYLLLGASFFGLLILLGSLNGQIRKRVPRAAVSKEQRGILLISEFALALYAIQVISDSTALEQIRTALHLFVGLIVAVMIGKAIIASLERGGSTKLIVASLLDDTELLLTALFIPIPVLFGVMLAVGTSFSLPGESVWIRFSLFALILVLLAVVYTGLIRRILGKPGAGLSLGLFRINNAVIVAGVPISLIPLAMPIANELQHVWTGASPRLIASILVLLLVLASVLLYRLQAKGIISLNSWTALAVFYFPILVVTLVTFGTHQQNLVLGGLDYLKMGEQTVPTQQLLRFGNLPFLDLLPAHGLSDLATQMMYSIANGYQGLDMVVWAPWLSQVGIYLLVYSFLAVTASPIVAVLATVLLPVQALIAAPYAVALLPAIALVVAIRRPTFWTFFSLWLLAATLIFWRWEQGSVAALALLLVVAAALTERREAVVPAIKSLLVALTLVPILLIVLDVLWVGSIRDAITALLATHNPKITAGGTRTVAPSVAVTLRYFLLPAAAILVLLYYGLRRMIGPGRIRPRTHAVLFASVFSLVVAVRSAMWPSSGSWFDPVLFLVVLAVAPYCWDSAVAPKRMLNRSTIWLLAVFVLSVPMGKTAWGHLSESFDNYSLTGQNDLFRFHRWRAGESRVLYDESGHVAVARFLEGELEEDETFFDLTDSPLLYVFTDREFPTNLMANRNRTSETIQSAVVGDLESLRDEGRLPMVLFRTETDTSNSLSELPTEVRSYRIAEYVYKNYLPYLEIDGYEIWRERAVELGRTQEPVGRPIQSATLTQDFWLGKLPYIWARFDPEHALERTEVLSTLHKTPTKLDTRTPLALGVDVMTDRSEGNYLQIRARPLDGAIATAGRVEGPVISIEYGRPKASGFHLELLPRQPQPWDESRSMEAPPLADFKARNLKPLEHRDGRVFRAVGNDPHIFTFVDLSEAPVREAGTELWVRLRYRSTASGMMQIFFATDKSGFRERNSIRVQAKSTGLEGEAAEIVVPVLGEKKKLKLTDLRIDPPTGSDFEIVGVDVDLREPAFDDYLVRLSSQWRWSSTNIDKLVLKASGPVMVGEVLLRRGD